jgi:hypothetical protein
MKHIIRWLDEKTYLDGWRKKRARWLDEKIITSLNSKK